MIKKCLVLFGIFISNFYLINPMAYFINNTTTPALTNTMLEFTLITADGKSKQNIGQFQSSLDLNHYEISQKNPVKLLVKAVHLPLTVTNRPSVVSEILKKNTTYSITTEKGDDAGSLLLFITSTKK